MLARSASTGITTLFGHSPDPICQITSATAAHPVQSQQFFCNTLISSSKMVATAYSAKFLLSISNGWRQRMSTINFIHASPT